VIAAGTINTNALDKIIKRLGVVVDLNQKDAVAPLLADFYAVIVEDNRRGVMLGIDCHDKPAPPLKYRNAAKIQSAPRSMKSGLFGTQNEARFKGMAPRAAKMLPNNNLTTQQYKSMRGPRQAPRRDSSRVISNLRFYRSEQIGNTWFAEAYWPEYLDAKGKPILPRAFQGTSKMAAYPLNGVREYGKHKAMLIAKAYFLRLLKVYA
jgi:hypothetical protein